MDTPEHPRLRVSLLRLRGHAPNLHETEAGVHQAVHRLRMLVETRSKPHGVGKSKPENGGCEDVIVHRPVLEGVVCAKA